jgi:hypothetical protein
MADLLMDPRKSTTMLVSAVEVYQDLAYDLLNDSAPLAVGSKGKDQLCGQAGAVSGTISATKEAVKGTHPAGCRCRSCTAFKMAKQEELRRKMCERRGELYVAPGGDPMQTKERAPENKARKIVPSGGKDVDYATVGGKLLRMTTISDVLAMCRTIELSRASVSHDLNERSSRSHCLVSVHLVSKGSRSKLFLVDLAGSERIAKSGVTGVARAQAIEINKSLTSLGRVIKALSSKQPHVPYRDSTLTMLLRDSFGGRACTSVVVCVADCEEHAEETGNSLQFGSRLGGVRQQQQVARIAEALPSSWAGRDALDRLEVARGELERMTMSGMGEGVDVTASEAQAKAFERNATALREIKVQIEALARREYDEGLKKPSRDLAGLKEKERTLASNIERAKSAVDRLSGRKFWKEKSWAFAKKEAEIRELVTAVELAGY